jgi:hypothetical protein
VCAFCDFTLVPPVYACVCVYGTYRRKAQKSQTAVATCRVILPGGRDLQQPWSLCAEAEASRDTFSALDGASLAGCFSYLSVATSASGQTLLIKDNGKRFISEER